MAWIYTAAVGAVIATVTLSALYGLRMAVMVNLHSIGHIALVEPVGEAVGHFSGLPWALPVVAVTVSCAALTLEQPTAVHALNDLPHEPLKLHLIDGPVRFPHGSSLTRAGCRRCDVVVLR